MKIVQLIKSYFLPLNRETLDAWVKLLDDVTRAAVLGIASVLWLSTQSVINRIIAVVLLFAIICISQWLANYLRNNRSNLSGKE